MHELFTHYFCCHAAMEAYAMATVRNLPDAHPVSKMLLPHFRYTMAINSRARATLINDGGIIDTIFSLGEYGKKELMKRASAEYHVDLTNVERSIEKRGVGSLPGYYYGEDGLRVFKAIKELYVRAIIDTFYADDDEVAADSELQDWAKEIHTKSFPGYYGAEQGHGFPIEIKTKDQLVERCTVIAFTGSAQHASINFGQYHIYGYVPNAPFAMRKPPPTEKGKANHKRLLKTLPDKTTAVLSIGVTYLLSQYSSGEVSIYRSRLW